MNRDQEGMKLLKAMNDIDDRMIEEAGNYGDGKKKKAYGFRWSSGLAAAFAVLVLGFLMIYRVSLQPHNDQAMQGSPYEEVSDLKEAESITGFSMSVPEIVEPYEKMSVVVIDGNMIELTFADAEGNAGYSLRKGKGNEDVSGDYTEYPQIKEIKADQIDVTLKGTDGKWSLAVWKADGYSYSLQIQDAVLSEDQIMTAVEEMNG